MDTHEPLHDPVDGRGVVADVCVCDLDDAFAFAGEDGGRHHQGEQSENQLARHLFQHLDASCRCLVCLEAS